MPWRLGKKVPINVYDDTDRPVCQCHTTADALQIVYAVNQQRYLEAEIPRLRGMIDAQTAEIKELKEQLAATLLGPPPAADGK